MKTPIFAFTLSMIMCLGARAELKWEQTSVELHPAANDKQAVGHFNNQNTGKTPVHFKSVHASCGCTTAQSQKEKAPEKKARSRPHSISARTRFCRLD